LIHGALISKIFLLIRLYYVLILFSHHEEVMYSQIWDLVIVL